MDNNHSYKILSNLSLIFDSSLPRRLADVLRDYPESDMLNCFSKGQILSKKWLIEEMHKALGPEHGVIFVLAGWYGTLPLLMFESQKFQIKHLRSFDIDPKCETIADSLNRDYVLQDWKFKAATADIYKLNYEHTEYVTHRADQSICPLSDQADLIINTSCEHLEHFAEWLKQIPQGTKLILQSNNFREPKEHLNCSEDLNEFLKQANLSKVYFSGELQLPKYKRFMLIGEK